MLFSACEWERDTKDIPLVVGLEGTLVEHNAGLFTGEYSIELSSGKEVLVLAGEGMGFDKEVGAKVIALGTLPTKKQTTQEINAVTIIDLKPLSYDWNEISSKSILGKIKVPLFVKTEETTEGLLLQQSSGKLAMFSRPLLPIPPATDAVEIQMGKTKALRSIENNSLLISIPEKNLKVEVFNKTGDTSLIYSILETYEEMPQIAFSSASATPTASTSEAKKSNTQWGQYFFTEIMKNPEIITKEENTYLSRVNINANFIDVEYKNAEGKYFRRILQLSNMESLALFTLQENEHPTWKHLEGTAPNSSNLFSLATLSLSDPLIIPADWQWLVVDSLGFQVAFPKKMYYVETDAGVRLQYYFGPVLEGDAQSNSFIQITKVPASQGGKNTVPLSANEVLDITSSPDIPADIMKSIIHSIITYPVL